MASGTRVTRKGGALPAGALAGARTGVGDGTTDGRQGLRWLVLPIRLSARPIASSSYKLHLASPMETKMQLGVVQLK
jgi:hypothetical protein